MIVSSRCAHASGQDVVRDDVLGIGKPLVANAAAEILLHDFSLEQLFHFRCRADLSVTTLVMWVVNAPHRSLKTALANRGTAAAKERLVKRAQLSAAEFHG